MVEPVTVATLAWCTTKCTIIDSLWEGFNSSWDEAWLHGQIRTYCQENLALPTLNDIWSNITLPSKDLAKATKCMVECLTGLGIPNGPSFMTRADNVKGLISCDCASRKVRISMSFEASLYITVGKHELKVKSKPQTLEDSGTVAYNSCCFL